MINKKEAIEDLRKQLIISGIPLVSDNLKTVAFRLRNGDVGNVTFYKNSTIIRIEYPAYGFNTVTKDVIEIDESDIYDEKIGNTEKYELSDIARLGRLTGNNFAPRTEKTMSEGQIKIEECRIQLELLKFTFEFCKSYECSFTEKHKEFRLIVLGK